MRPIFVVRLRGRVNVRKDIADTLHILRLRRTNYATIVYDTPSYLGMLQKAKDWIAWGYIKDPQHIAEVLRARGELIGRKRLNDENVKQLGFNSIDELAKALFEGKVTLSQLKKKGLKPFFRLHPPRKGLKSVKKAVGAGGSLGKWEDIWQLVKRMI